MESQIMPMTNQHLARAAALYVSVFNAEPYSDRWTVASARTRLSEMLSTPGFIGLVHLDEAGSVNGLLVGCVRQWYDGRVYELHEMCVAPDDQRKGIGSRLMRNLENRLKEEGVVLSYLMTRKGGPGEIFYSKKGYQINQRSIVMLLPLIGTSNS